MRDKLQELKEKHRKCCLNRGISIFSVKDIEWLIETIESQQAEIDSLSMAHDTIHRKLSTYKESLPKDKHMLIKNLIALNREVEKLKVYADENSKKTGELNEFLQQRDAGKHLGKHVIDAVMGYVQELEEDNEDIRWLCADTSIKLQESDKRVERYREVIVRAKTLLANIGDDTSSKMSAISILTKALEESE